MKEISVVGVRATVSRFFFSWVTKKAVLPDGIVRFAMHIIIENSEPLYVANEPIAYPRAQQTFAGLLNLHCRTYRKGKLNELPPFNQLC